jgi:site-specific recombinase XerD
MVAFRRGVHVQSIVFECIARIEQLEVHLRTNRYAALIQRRYLWLAQLGRKGPHAFRHARAVSLLRAAVPLNIIGHVLGHRSAESTAVYLKLATEDLRAVGLDLPKEVLP